MAHARKDTLVPFREYHKHLRPFFKRVQAGRERRAGKREIKEQQG